MNKTTISKAVWPLIIFVIALTIRIVYIFTSQNNPFFSVPIIDMRYYWSFAGDLLSKGFFGVPEFMSWKPILYPLFLAAIRFFTGSSIISAQIIQSILGAVNCVLLYVLAKCHFNQRTSFIAGILMACYGTFVFFDATFLSVTLNIFFTLCMLLSMAKLSEETNSIKWIVPGFFLALASNTHQIILIYMVTIPFIIYLWYWKSDTRNLPTIQKLYNIVLKRLFFFLIGFLLIVVPIAFNKYIQCKDFSISSNNAGVNLYIGNNPQTCVTKIPPMGIAWSRLINEPVYKGNDLGGKTGHSHYFYHKVFDFFVNDPAGFAKLFIKKAVFLFSAFEINTEYNAYRYTDYSPVLKCLLWANRFMAFPLGLILPLSIVGLSMSLRKDRRKFLHYHLFLASIYFGIAIFFVFARYRMLLIPVIILFAASSIDALLLAIKSRRLTRKKLYFAGLFFASLILCNYNNGYLAQTNTDQDYIDFQQLANCQFAVNLQLDAAEETIKKAIELNPDYADSYYIMGGIQREKGNLDLALSYLNIALVKDSAHQEARKVVAGIKIQKGEYKQASDELMNILFKEEDWYNEKLPTAAAQMLGDYYSAMGNLSTAAVFYEKYLSFGPDTSLPENKDVQTIMKFLVDYKERNYEVLLGYVKNVLAKNPSSKISNRQLSEITAMQSKYEYARTINSLQ